MIALDFGFGAVEAELWRLLFTMLRLGAAFAAAPLFGAMAVPYQLRVVLAGAVAVLVCAWQPVTVPPALFSLEGLIVVIGEVLLGLSLGFVLQLAFAAPVIAAEVIGGAMGMSIASTVDPNSGTQSPVLGQYFSVLLTLLFLGLGCHLLFIRLLVESYTTFPPGAAWLGPGRIQAIAGFGSSMFATAVAIALPVTFVLLLVQIVSGVVSRSAPSLNLFALGIPAGVLAGFAALIAALPLMSELMVALGTQAIEQARMLVLP